MLTPTAIKAIDESRLHEDYEEWPAHCLSALSTQVQSPQISEVRHVICTGMGGSGIVGDILLDWLQHKIAVPIYVVKDYHLPRFIDDKSLVIAVSCSGNTEETIGTVNEALKAGARIATISSGGILEKMSLNRQIAYTKIRSLVTPRSSLPYLFYAAANVLRDTGLLKNMELELHQSAKDIEHSKRLTSIYTNGNRNPAKRLAEWICGGLPVVYTSQLLRSSALRFKNSLNENAKMHACVDLLPELCHNGIEAWTRDSRIAYRPVFLRNTGEPSEVRERFKLTERIIEEAGFKVESVQSSATASLGTIMSTIYLLDYASIYAAVLRNVDPTPTPNISELKRELGRAQSGDAGEDDEPNIKTRNGRIT